MALSWSARRQLLYYTVAGVVSMIIVLFGWKLLFTHTPTCSDRIHNGTELGVDCGGSCSLICAADAKAPRIQWARAFKIDTNLYTAAAYIENPNIGAGARLVRYSFQLFDQNNILVVERDGMIDIPPIALIPVVEPNINTGTREVARTLFSFANVPVWNKISSPLVAPHIKDQILSADGTRLTATLTNDTIKDMGRVIVAAVLFDSEGVARAASKTTISKIPRKSSQPVVFTWPNPLPDVVRAELTVIPTF